MSDDSIEKKKIGHFAFILNQLRDDLDEIVSGVETGNIGFDTALVGAATQVQWVLNELKKFD